MKRGSNEKKTLLLSDRGKLNRSFWSAAEETEYNREQQSRFRAREWEQFQLLGDGFVFRLLFGQLGPVGLCRAAFTDLSTGEYCISGPMQLFSGDSYSLDYAVSQPHHFFRDEADLFMSLDYDGQYYRLRCHGERFDVELMLPFGGDMLFSAAPFKNPRRFFYAGRKVFPELRGSVSFDGQSYTLAGAFASMESCRAALPRKTARVYCSGAQVKDGHSLAFVFGWGFGYTAAGLENGLFVDGSLMKLNRVREQRKGSFMTPARFVSEDGAVDLRFTPKRDELFARDLRLLYFRSHCTVGTVSGRVRLRGVGELPIEAMPALCEHSRFCF